MSTIYVLNKDGKPLMPTTRGGHVRHLRYYIRLIQTIIKPRKIFNSPMIDKVES